MTDKNQENKINNTTDTKAKKLKEENIKKKKKTILSSTQIGHERTFLSECYTEPGS